MSHSIIDTNFHFPSQLSLYKGKVREVYTLKDDLLVMVATDRLSAFDVVMPRGIPFKGQILNQIATKMMESTADLVPNWLVASPDPNVAVGYLCKPFKVEMVIRGYMSGHAAREYKAGKRLICGINMPEGMKENDLFPTPVITPATKAEMGDHDEDISREDIIKRGIVSEADYVVLEDYTRKLFQRGSEIADYESRQAANEPQKQLSKEFVRQWLISNDFQGLEGQSIPYMSDEYIKTVSDRYVELYENITGESFVKADISNIQERIETNVLNYLKTL
jgi:phosphoribosylaminoimidazole-succinocarboxamide synthase